MLYSADLIRELLELVDVPLAVKIIDLFERDSVTSRVTSRVTQSALRQRKYRQNIKAKQRVAKANDVATDVTDEHNALRNAVSLSVDKKGTSDSQIGNREVRKKNTDGVTGRGTRLEPSAQLSDTDRQFARDYGLKDGQIGALWVEFVDYWIAVPGQRGTKLNWSATWRNRVRMVGSKGGLNGKASAGDRAREFARQIREVERTKGTGRPPEFFGSDGDRGDVARPIPQLQKLG